MIDLSFEIRVKYFSEFSDTAVEIFLCKIFFNEVCSSILFFCERLGEIKIFLKARREVGERGIKASTIYGLIGFRPP